MNQGFLLGRLGTVLMPGSAQVLDRLTLQLVNCSSCIGMCTDTIHRGNTTLMLNRAPFSGKAVPPVIAA